MLLSIRMVALGCLAASALFACQDKPKDGTPPFATNQELTGATLTRAVISAERDFDVMRFSDEVKLAPTSAVVMGSVVRLRKAPGGEPILVASSGAEVTEIARAHDHYLVEVTDPRDHTRR